MAETLPPMPMSIPTAIKISATGSQMAEKGTMLTMEKASDPAIPLVINP